MKMNNKTFTTSFLGILTIVAYLMLFVGLGIAQKTEEKAKKKLYISTIKANGVPAATANRIKEGIRLAIFEGFGTMYQVFDDDAIKVMYKQAEAILSSGCDDKSCITQIADGINADEIVYGEVSQETIKITINITDLERKGVSLGTKSIVKIAFLESQLDWFATETAKKLIDPAYKIDTSKAPRIRDDIKIGGIEIKSVDKLDINVIQFKTSDESIERIIAVLKKNVGEADAIYAQNNYIKARVRYEEIISDIKERLRPEKQEKVKEFTDGIIKRIDTTWIMQYKPDIEKVDILIKEKKEPKEGDMRKALKKYDSIEEDVLKISDVNKDAKNQLLKAINDRKDSIHTAMLSMYEKKGDIDYRDYKFDSAMENYKIAQGEADYITVANKLYRNSDRLAQKITTTTKTGFGYMENRIKSLIDQAEYQYFDKQESDARSTMKKAASLMTGPMKIFATIGSEDIYNKMAVIMKIDRITFFEEQNRAEDEKKRDEEEKVRNEKMKQMLEKEKRDDILLQKGFQQKRDEEEKMRNEEMKRMLEKEKREDLLLQKKR